MPLATGTKLGPYEIQSPAGAGGMGEVYRARDTRLDRTVAVKVLPSHSSSDSELRLRFDREARAISSLQHPHICTLHDVGHQDGIDYLVMEYVEGETLERRLARGPLPPEQVMRYAMEIAEALDKAHRNGIIHRDLKPGNVMVTKAGAKLLDFGLAKVVAKRDEPEVTEVSPRLTLTSEGTLLGTFQYMAPEQLEGGAADARSDIFALGTIIYEMTTGRPAFTGSSKASVIAAVLSSEPPPMTSKGTIVPPALERVVRQCLVKDPEERSQCAHDVLVELRWVAQESAPAQAQVSRTTARKRVPGLRGATVLVLLPVLGALLTFLWLRHAQGTIQPSVANVARLTHDPAISEWPTWSPAGSLLAFASNRDGNFQIYVLRSEGGQQVNITNDSSQNYQPAFSPDGNSIAFISTRSSRSGMIKIGGAFGFDFRTNGGDLWVAPALGGAARRLAEDANYPAWSPGGQKIAYVTGLESHRSIMELPAGGGTPTPLLPSAASSWEIRRIQYAPHGQWVSFETTDDQVMLIPAKGGQPHSLVYAMSHVWDPSGKRLYYLHRDSAGGTRLLSVEVDEETGRTAGEAHTVSVTTGLLRDVSIAEDGKNIALSELEGSMNLTRLPLKADGSGPAGPEEVLTSGHVIDRWPAVSPDGQRIAFGSDRMGTAQIWIMDLKTRRAEALELPGNDIGVSHAVWTADGRQIIVTRALPDRKQALWLIALDGSRAEELVPERGGVTDVLGGGVSPDGRKVLYMAITNGIQQIFSLDVITRRTQQLTSSPGDKVDGIWSPDGTSIAFFSSRGGPLQLWKMAANGTQEQQLTTGFERMRHAFFSPDGRWIYYQPSHRNIYRIPADGGTTQQVTHFPESDLFIEEPTISPDGKYLLYSRSHGGASLWLFSLK